MGDRPGDSGYMPAHNGTITPEKRFEMIEKSVDEMAKNCKLTSGAIKKELTATKIAMTKVTAALVTAGIIVNLAVAVAGLLLRGN